MSGDNRATTRSGTATVFRRLAPSAAPATLARMAGFTPRGESYWFATIRCKLFPRMSAGAGRRGHVRPVELTRHRLGVGAVGPPSHRGDPSPRIPCPYEREPQRL